MADTPAVRGAARLRQRLQRIRVGAAAILVGNDLAETLLRRIKARFLAQVDPDYQPWAPLAARTQRYRGRAKGILYASGRLYGSLGIIRGRHQGLLTTNTGVGARIGVRDPEIARYGRAHQFGTTHLPARRFLGVGARDVASVDAVLRQLIIAKMGLRPR